MSGGRGTRQRRRTHPGGAAIAGLFAAFAGLGVTASLFPALLPLLGERIGVAPESALAGIPLLFAGLFAGVLVSSATASITRLPHVLALGSALQFVGILLLATAPTLSLLLVAAAVAGFGFGLAEASASARAKELSGGQPGSSSTPALLAALTAAVAVAAALCPLVVALLLPPPAVPPFAVAVGAVHLVAATLALAARPAAVPPPAAVPTSTPPASAPAPTSAHPAPASPASPIPTSVHPTSTSPAPTPTATRGSPGGVAAPPRRARRILLPAAVALFLYVGVESTFSGWSAAVPRDLLGLSARTAALGTSAFWRLMAGGRYLAVAALRSGIRTPLVLRLCCLLSGLGLVVAALAAAPLPGLALAAMGVATVGLGPCYSLILGSALERVDGPAARRATGLLVAAGSAGGTLLPGVIVLFALDPVGPAVLLGAAALLLAVLAAAAAAAPAARAAAVAAATTAAASAPAARRPAPRPTERRCRTDAPPDRRR